MSNRDVWIRFKQKLSASIADGKFYLKPDLKQAEEMEVNLGDDYYAKLTNFHPIHEETGQLMKVAKMEVYRKIGFQ